MRRMPDISVLLRALPVSELEATAIAGLDGFLEPENTYSSSHLIKFLEPPAKARVPYLEPQSSLVILLRSQGMDKSAACHLADHATALMRTDIAEEHWCWYLDYFDSTMPGCVPVPEFIQWLRQSSQEPESLESGQPEGLECNWSKQGRPSIREDLLDFLQDSCNKTIEEPLFTIGDLRSSPLSLQELPELPHPKSMIHFMPGPTWMDEQGVGPGSAKKSFARWRRLMQDHVVPRLEASLGQCVYRFADQDLYEGREDHDDIHRFLVLHWCCTHLPDSGLVLYLVRSTGASDVEALKMALIDPASYQHPFEMNDSFFAPDSGYLRLWYRPE